jgi:hypothetical protein
MTSLDRAAGQQVLVRLSGLGQWIVPDLPTLPARRDRHNPPAPNRGKSGRGRCAADPAALRVLRFCTGTNALQSLGASLLASRWTIQREAVSLLTTVARESAICGRQQWEGSGKDRAHFEKAPPRSVRPTAVTLMFSILLPILSTRDVASGVPHW